MGSVFGNRLKGGRTVLMLGKLYSTGKFLLSLAIWRWIGHKKRKAKKNEVRSRDEKLTTVTGESPNINRRLQTAPECS